MHLTNQECQNRNLQSSRYGESLRKIRAIEARLQSGNTDLTAHFEVIPVYEALIQDTKIERDRLILKRQRLDRRLSEGTLAQDDFVQKTRGLSRRWKKVGRMIMSLERRKLEERERCCLTQLSEVSVGCSVVRCHVGDPEVKRRIKQGGFRESVIQKYDLTSDSLEFRGEVIWDVLVGRYEASGWMKTVPILPAKMHPATIDYVCGPGSASRKYSWENGLMLTRTMEEYLNDGLIVIVPAFLEDDNARPDDYMIRVAMSDVDQFLARLREDGTYIRLAELDGRLVTWKNRHRPIMSFVCWRYITSMLSNKMYQAVRAKEHDDFLRSPELWRKLGLHLRKSVLAALAKSTGCLDEQAISSVLGHATEQDDQIAGSYSINEIIVHTSLVNRGYIWGRSIWECDVSDPELSESESESESEVLEDEAWKSDDDETCTEKGPSED